MPHSSGGGSHGGGFHGGGSHGRSGNRISTHYYPGARRYRRVYHDGRDSNEYVYAGSKPAKTGIGIIIFEIIFAIIFIGGSFLSISKDSPKKLSPKYSDDPAIYDDIGVISNKDELMAEMKKFHETTRICPVVYTVKHEEWLGTKGSLVDYTMNRYTSAFADEQHFVVVYSVPQYQLEESKERHIAVMDYMWEAVQGDETDPIITKAVFRRFGNAVQDSLENGEGPGRAFTAGFKKFNSAAEAVKPFTAKWIVGRITGSTPLIFIAGFFFFILFFTIKSYKRDKNIDYEEVPLDEVPMASADGVTSYTNADGSTTTVSAGPGYYNRHTDYVVSGSNVPKAIKIVGFVILIPFILIGIGILTGGLGMLKSDKSAGGFLIVFGAVWLIISLSSMIKMFTVMGKAGKKTADPLTAEYPKAEYPQAEYPDVQPAVPNNVPQASRPEFDPTFFGSAKSDYESDDEDYKRMKRQGYE